MKVDIVQYSDWVQIFVDGELKAGGHSFAPWMVLDAVGIEYQEYEVTEEQWDGYEVDNAKLTHLPYYVIPQLGEGGV